MAADTQYLHNYNIPGINLYVNPMYRSYEEQSLASDGELIRCVNMDSYPLGAKQKRAGYATFLDTADGSQINTLFSWIKDDGTSTFLYRFSGTTLYYYDAGAGTGTAWLSTGNGNFAGKHIGYAILGNTLICGDGAGSTRHTTDGTSFTNTTLAPVGEFFEQYQNRIYIGGTASTIFYSTAGDATNWNIAGTSDSSSFQIPGAGRINKVFKLGDRLNVGKSQGNIFKWDGFTLVDTATGLNMTSPYSYGTVEDSAFWLNRLGIFAADVQGPQLISNAITRYIDNEALTGIVGTTFNSAPGVTHKYNYYVAVGSIRDDFTNEPLNNALLKYNYQKNEFLTFQFNDNPTAFASYRDESGTQQMIFGNSTGQVFQYGGTATSDNNAPIQSVLEMVFTFNAPNYDKEWRWFWAYFNPGCGAEISVAMSNTFVRGKKNWIDLGDTSSGVVQFHFPPGARSKLLYLRIREASRTQRFDFYGVSLGAKLVDPG